MSAVGAGATGSGPVVAVLDYGIGNLRSAEKALQHVGARATLTADPGEIEAADAVVLPGVGAYGACVGALEATGLGAVAVAAIERGQPFLGICVGMQLLYAGSDESPGRPGLGVLEGHVRLLPAGVKRPQMQWNRLEPVTAGHPMLAGLVDPWVYFVHSYAAVDSEGVVATCDYGGPVTAAVAAGKVWATQFHPEKSGTIGLALLANFVGWVATGSPVTALGAAPAGAR